jgi:hypothetical protein
MDPVQPPNSLEIDSQLRNKIFYSVLMKNLDSLETKVA